MQPNCVEKVVRLRQDPDRPVVKTVLVKLPATILTLLSQQTGGGIIVQHVREEVKEITFPWQSFEQLSSRSPSEFEDFLGRQFPGIASVIVRYRESDGKLMPSSIQIFSNQTPQGRQGTTSPPWGMGVRQSQVDIQYLIRTVNALRERLTYYEQQVRELEAEVSSLKRRLYLLEAEKAKKDAKEG